MAKFSYPLEYVEGIGPAYAGKLKEIGIVTPLDLLKGGASPRAGRDREKSGISGKLILNGSTIVTCTASKALSPNGPTCWKRPGWIRSRAGHRNPKNLFDRMNLVNEEKKLVRKTPTQAQVENWVGQAKMLPLVNY